MTAEIIQFIPKANTGRSLFVVDPDLVPELTIGIERSEQHKQIDRLYDYDIFPDTSPCEMNPGKDST